MANIKWSEVKAELDRHKGVSYDPPRSNRTSGWTISIHYSGNVDIGTGQRTGGGDAELISQAHGEQGDFASHAVFNVEFVYDALREVGVRPTSEFIRANRPEGAPPAGDHRRAERERLERERLEREREEREREERRRGEHK